MENEIGDIFPCDKVVEISLLSGDGLEELEGDKLRCFFLVIYGGRRSSCSRGKAG